MAVPYRLASLSEVEVDSNLPLFADTETDGFYGAVQFAQLYQAGWPEVILVHRPNHFEFAGFVAKHKPIWHNAHYDLTTIQQQTSPSFKADFDDTFLLARLALPTLESYTLDSVMTHALGFDPYLNENLDKKALQKSDWAKPLKLITEDQLHYAAIDVYYMPEVWAAVKSKLDDQCYLLDKSTVNACLDFQWNGMPIDDERMAKKWEETETELNSIEMPINAGSWQQVRKWLDVDESDDIFLATLELRDGNGRAKRVRRVRKLKKLLSFLTKYAEFGERVIGKFKPSARSGRLTSNDENLQQIPRALKEIFGFPEDAGRILIYSDYAQVELRTICAILGVSLMEKMFRAGEDLHGFVASVLFGKDWTKDDRQVTKTYNFNLLYGGSIGMVLKILIKYGFLIEPRVANRHKTKWLNMFTEINKWQQESIAKWQRGKLGSTPFGRKYKGNLYTDQMNIMNQGAGAEVAKLALHYFNPWLKQYNLDNDCDFLIINFIHDSFIIDGPDVPELYEAVSIKLAECMQEAWFEMSKLYKIKDLPMPVDVAVGYNWGDIENGISKWQFSLEPYAMMEKTNATV